MTKLTLENLEQTIDRAFAPLEREVAELKQVFYGFERDVVGLQQAVNRIHSVPYPPSTSRRGREPVAHGVLGPIYNF
jgi:hypothetical protein